MQSPRFIMQETRDVLKELESLELTNARTKRWLLASNEMENRILQCKLVALEKVHKKSISTIDSLITENFKKLRSSYLTKGGSDGTTVAVGETLIAGKKEGCHSKPLLFPSLKHPKGTDVKKKIFKAADTHRLPGRHISNLNLRPMTAEKDIEKITFGCSEINSFQNRNMLGCVEQQLGSLRIGRTDGKVHVKEDRREMFDIPMIVVAAPCPKRQSCLRMVERRKSTGCFCASKIREYENGIYPVDNMLSVLAFDQKTPEGIAKSRKITRQKLPRLQTSIDLLSIPEIIEKGELLHKEAK